MFFSLTPSDQNTSPLLQLPTEIRSAILRSLLVHTGPLISRNRHVKEFEGSGPIKSDVCTDESRRSGETLIESYQLAPAILITCQLLYNEGQPMLYHLNTLGIQLWAHEYPTLFIYADPWVYLRSNDLQEPASSGVNLKFDWFLAQFVNIQIEIYTCEQNLENIRLMVTAFNEKLHGKSIQVKFVGVGTCFQNLDVTDQLYCLTSLRCKKFNVVNDPLISASELARITTLLTSSRPVLDLWKVLDNLKEYHKSLCQFCGANGPCSLSHQSFLCYDEDIWNELEDAVWCYDAVAFFETRSRLFNGVDNNLTKLRDKALKDDCEVDAAGLPVGHAGPE